MILTIPGLLTRKWEQRSAPRKAYRFDVATENWECLPLSLPSKTHKNNNKKASNHSTWVDGGGLAIKTALVVVRDRRSER